MPQKQQSRNTKQQPKDQKFSTLTKKATEKLPPHNLEAEQEVLGAILLDNAAMHKVLAFFDPEDFYRGSHRKIFDAMSALLDRGDPVDLLLLRDELAQREQLDEVGGPAYLAALMDATPTAANIEYHAKVVHDKAIKRNLLNTSIELALRCYDDLESAEELMEAATQKIYGITDTQTTSDFVKVAVVVPSVETHLETIFTNPSAMLGLPTGFLDLDAYLCGLQATDHIVLAARPSQGKTALSLNIGTHLALRQQEPVGMVSMEMSKEQIVLRMVAAEAKVDYQKLRSGKDTWGRTLTEEEYRKALSHLHRIEQAPFFIDESPCVTSLDLRMKVRRLKYDHGITALMTDYLQLMEGPDRRRENRQQEMAEISRSMKMLAMELGITVISNSQLNRNCEYRNPPRPKMADLRDSGAIEQDADVVIFIYRPEIYGIEGSEGMAELIIGKQRNGPVGTVQLAFVKEYTRFENLDTRHEDPEEVF